MINYKDAIRCSIAEMDEKRERVICTSEQLKSAMSITDEEIGLLHRHGIGIEIPSLGLVIRSNTYAWSDWEKLLTVCPINDSDHSPLQWVYVPDDEELKSLVEKLNEIEDA